MDLSVSTPTHYPGALVRKNNGGEVASVKARKIREKALSDKLLNDKILYDRLKNNCLHARKEYNWQNEEKILLKFYSDID